MAGMNNFSKFFLVFLFCFLLISSEIVEAKKDEKKESKKDEKKVGKKNAKRVCERKSKSWSGLCMNSKKCDKQCKSKEKAEKGICRHKGVFVHDCICYFKC